MIFEVKSMSKYLMSVIAFAYSFGAFGQLDRAHSQLTFTGAVGKYEGSAALHFVHVWDLGKKQKFSIGYGFRFTSYLGANQYYITAPAELTSESTSPLIFFKENIVENIDSLLIKSPQVNMLNASINIHYRISHKFAVGFNIDAIGFSFGGTQTANYINGYTGKITEAKPTEFNILLISDNDRGSLNSELFGTYAFNEKWNLKLGTQFLFTEYTTTTKVQQYPEANDRFRDKSLMLVLGLGYTFK